MIRYQAPLTEDHVQEFLDAISVKLGKIPLKPEVYALVIGEAPVKLRVRKMRPAAPSKVSTLDRIEKIAKLLEQAANEALASKPP